MDGLGLEGVMESSVRKAKQSTTKNVMVLMVDSTDHVAGKTGLTLTITASKDGGAFASISPAVTERGNGWYALALIASHTDTLGELALHITGTAADPADMVLLVEARSVDDEVIMQDVDRPSTENGQAQSGTPAQITLRTGASATNNLFIGQKISIYAGTGAGQTRGISSYNGTTKVCAVARNWTTAPDATSMYRVEHDFGPKVNNALQVFVNDGGSDLVTIPWNAAWNAAVAAAILNAAQTTPIHSDTRKMNGATVNGNGSAGNLWRGA